MEDLQKIKEFFSKEVGEAETNISNDIPDIIAVDVPLFIRLLEYAREDSENDLDLHDVAERAIEAVKMRGVLSMDDYETLIPSKEELDEVRLVPKDQIEAIAAKLAAQIFSKKQDTRPAIDILKKAVEDSYRALDPDVEIREEEGYSKFLKDDPEFPGGKTPGLTPDVLDKILMKIVQDIDETKRLGENLNEELCPKGKAYIKRRKAAGEKSSAYLSGRAVKVCKGQMSGRSKKKVNKEAIDEADARDKAAMAFDKMKVGNTIKTSKGEFKKVDDKHFEMVGKPGRKFTAKQMTYITPPAK